MATQLVYSNSDRLVYDTPINPCAQYLAPESLSSAPFLARWDELVFSASEPNPFHESWFLLPALREFDPQNQSKIFTIWSGSPFESDLLGLMPVCDLQHYGRWPIAHRQNWLHPNAFLGNPLVRRGHEELFWRVLLKETDKKSGKSMFMHLNGLNINGRLQKALETVCAEESRCFALVHREERAFLQSELTAQEYYEASMRSKKRKELRRQKNRLEELGGLSFSRSDGSNALDEWIDTFLMLERKGWKGNNSSALDCSVDTRRLFKEALCGAAKQNRLELLDLRLDKKPIAMLVNFLCPPGSFSFKTTFDEEYSRFSPGVLLQIENLDLLERPELDWCDSCAAEGHPMIDSIWSGRRAIGRYSVAIGGSGKRALFGLMLQAEVTRMRSRNAAATVKQNSGAE